MSAVDRAPTVGRFLLNAVSVVSAAVCVWGVVVACSIVHQHPDVRAKVTASFNEIFGADSSTEVQR